ncbi:mediator of RNA polymerase II transcription subunit 24-like isoform X2 [Tubulanus polymorphus]|uniref:mediator of RNA polymerase II transcription subunit 24-like isoform X2 n=1 Tax=Tubulanus polymorphus TaxID=672921 RepID=UPI003DA2292A
MYEQMVTTEMLKAGPVNIEEKKKSIRYLLLQAWRERWNDIQWSSNLKKIIKNQNGDQVFLANIILEQALVGKTPNALMLSYLKNAISSQVITFTSSLQGIMKYDDVNKPYCVKSLMDLVADYVKRACHYGNTEDAMNLSKTLLHFIKWLLSCSHKCLQKMSDNKHAPEFTAVIDKTCELLKSMIEKRTIRAMLHIAIMDESETFREIEQTEANVRGTLSQVQNASITPSLREKVDASLKLLNKISEVSINGTSVLNMSNKIGNPSVAVLIPQEAVLNPTGDIQLFVDQLLLIEKLQGLNRTALYCDILQACLYGLIDAGGGQEELKWVAFTFLKIPQIISKMQVNYTSSSENDVEQSLDMLLRYTPLLDLADVVCNCDCLQFLLQELCNKQNLIGEATMERLGSKRTSESRKPKLSESSVAQPSPGLILRAEPTVMSILKTLDADYSKNQEALLGVLCHMMSGKSFELILAAAAATGKLQSFAIKLIKFNEFAKHATAEAGKAAQTRAMLFDISFLMLCHITQLYGTEVRMDIISQQKETADSFFAQWAQCCLPEDGKFKSPDLYPIPESNKVDALLSQFNVGGELKTVLARWHEVCQNAPFAVQEILYAWECGAVTSESVKTMLDNVKSKMCCLPVVVSAWLGSYINIVGEEARQKPLLMLQQLLTPVNPDPSNQFYIERCNLMTVILQRMVQDLLPEGSIKTSIGPELCLTKNQLALDLLTTTWKDINKKGCITLKYIHTMEQLLNIGGSRWFCDGIVKEMLCQSHPEDLQKAVCLTYGLFHMDIEQLTLCLLCNTIPLILQSTDYKSLILIDPKGRTLAQLCTMCVAATFQVKQHGKDSLSLVRRGRKRTRKEYEMDEEIEEVKPNKQRKLHEEVLTLTTEDFNYDFSTDKEEVELVPQYDTKDPLNKALVRLFSLFHGILADKVTSPRTGFVINFIKEAIRCGGKYSAFMLQFMPANMLLKSLPGSFTTDLLLSACDLKAYRGRCIAAKAVCQNSKLEYQQLNSHQIEQLPKDDNKLLQVKNM